MGGNMLLRNKETGEIFDWQEGDMPFGLGLPHPKSLAELNEDWEDYEPLIKDEKIRKAVRAWADANSLKWAAYSADGKFYDKTTDTEISFTTYTNRLDIPECRLLPIAELCGEEE